LIEMTSGTIRFCHCFVCTIRCQVVVMISQTRKIKATSLLQIPAFEELLSIVLNYIWTIMWKVSKMRGLGSHNSH
jgi:hypothetical protein